MAKNKTGKRLRQAERREALAVVAELLARRVSNAKIKKALAQRFNVSARTGDRYISQVLKGWAEEDNERQEYRRNQTRRSLEGIVEGALLGHEKGVGTDEQGRPVYRRQPDYKAAVAASRVLARVDGVLDTPEASALGSLLSTVLEGLADSETDPILDVEDGQE